MLVNASISTESILITLEAVSEAGNSDPQYQTLRPTLKGNNFANVMRKVISLNSTMLEIESVL